MTDEMIGIILLLLLNWFVFYKSKILGLKMVAGVMTCVIGFYSLLIVSEGISIFIIVFGAFITLNEGYNAVKNMSKFT